MNAPNVPPTQPSYGVPFVGTPQPQPQQKPMPPITTEQIQKVSVDLSVVRFLV